MISRKLLVGTVTLWTAVLAFFLWERHAESIARSNRELRAHERTAMLGQIQALEKASSEKRDELADLIRAEANARIAKRARANPSARDQIEGTATTIANNPGLRAGYMKGYVADLYTRWGLFFRQQGMSTGQIAQFNGIQIRLEDAKLDLAAKAVAQNLSPDDPELANELAQANREFYRDLRDLIGAPNYPAYKAYSQETSVIALVNDLPAYGLAESEPLSDAQSLQLAQILADSSAKYSSGWTKYGTVNWEQAMPLAQAMLTPSQFESLQLLEATKLMVWRKGQAAGK